MSEDLQKRTDETSVDANSDATEWIEVKIPRRGTVTMNFAWDADGQQHRQRVQYHDGYGPFAREQASWPISQKEPRRRTRKLIKSTFALCSFGAVFTFGAWPALNFLDEKSFPSEYLGFLIVISATGVVWLGAVLGFGELLNWWLPGDD